MCVNCKDNKHCADDCCNVQFIVCPICKGEGKAFHRDLDDSGNSIHAWDICDACNGSGKVDSNFDLHQFRLENGL